MTMTKSAQAIMTAIAGTLAVAVIAHAGGGANAGNGRVPGIAMSMEPASADVAEVFTSQDLGEIAAKCSCSCTSQGVLLQNCDGDTSNLGDHGTKTKCEEARRTHPGCR